MITPKVAELIDQFADPGFCCVHYGPVDHRKRPVLDALEAFIQSTDSAAPKHRGRKKADYATVQSEAKTAADWERARDSHVRKAEFAEQKKMTLEELDLLLDRVASRKRNSE